MKRNKSMILAFTIPGTLLFLLTFVYPVSYTHLDVYKRQK